MIFFKESLNFRGKEYIDVVNGFVCTFTFCDHKTRNQCDVACASYPLAIPHNPRCCSPNRSAFHSHSFPYKRLASLLPRLLQFMTTPPFRSRSSRSSTSYTIILSPLQFPTISHQPHFPIPLTLFNPSDFKRFVLDFNGRRSQQDQFFPLPPFLFSSPSSSADLWP